MKSLLSGIVILTVAAFCVAASADTLALATGGQVEGTIEKMTFFLNGAEKAFARGAFVSVKLTANFEDTVQVDAAKTETGEVLTVEIRTVAGVLTFKRREMTGITITTAKDEEIRKEYAAKKAALKEGDATGLCALAMWCKEKGLVIEARQNAELCLKSKPTTEAEVLAHRVLGQVLKDGAWVDASTVVASTTTTTTTEPAPTQPTATTPEVDAKVIDQATADLYRKLVADYTQKVTDGKTKDQDAVKTQYKAQWDKVTAEVTKVQAQVQQTRDRRSQLRDDIAINSRGITANGTAADWDLRRQVDDQRHEYDQLNDKLSQLETTLNKNLSEQAALAAKITTARTDAAAHSRQREQNLALAKSRVERVLLTGRKLTEAEMRAVFDEAVK